MAIEVCGGDDGMMGVRKAGREDWEGVFWGIGGGGGRKFMLGLERRA